MQGAARHCFALWQFVREAFTKFGAKLDDTCSLECSTFWAKKSLLCYELLLRFDLLSNLKPPSVLGVLRRALSGDFVC